MTQLKVKTRDKETANELRKTGLIPAVVYSKGEQGNNLIISHIDFEKVYNEAGESSLVDLVSEKDSKKVLIQDIQTDPVSGKFLHIDFYEVDLKKKVTAPVELEFVGEAPVVKSDSGIVIKQLKEIEIECLPTDLIKKFKIDISGLTEFSSAIHIKDLKISDSIAILNDLDDVVVNVSEPRIEEEKPVETEETPAEGEAGAKPEEGKSEGEAKPEEGKAEEKK